MKIDAFRVEEWMNANEERAAYNLAETCVNSVTLAELFALCGEDPAAFWRDFSARRMTYGSIWGSPDFLQGVCGLYETIRPQHIIPTHGAAGANHLLMTSLVEPGDHVVSIRPAYQQLYSIPRSVGAEVELMHLRPENGYLPDFEELRALTRPNTKLICVNNPHNPSGAVMDGGMLRELVSIARSCGAYLLCDEVYRPLTQDGAPMDSIVDLYEKGISVGSMSKVFSLAGLRLGWIATRDEAARAACLSHRDYCLISCGMFDEAAAALALRHADKLIARSRGVIRENLALLDAWVQQTPGVSFVRPNGGSTALLHFGPEVDSVQLCSELLEETGVFLTPGDCFEEPHTARIGYACAREALVEGLARMGELLAARRN